MHRTAVPFEPPTTVVHFLHYYGGSESFEVDVPVAWLEEFDTELGITFGGASHPSAGSFGPPSTTLFTDGWTGAMPGAGDTIVIAAVESSTIVDALGNPVQFEGQTLIAEA